MKRAAVLLGLVAAFAGTTPARSEQQLPPNELYSCEIVLHELIAELAKLRVVAKRELIVALAAPDGGTHVCAPPQVGRGKGVLFCVILPPEG